MRGKYFLAALLVLVLWLAREFVGNPANGPTPANSSSATISAPPGVAATSALAHDTNDVTLPPNVPASVRTTIARIDAGEHLRFRDDGIVFQNREGLLPSRPRGYYHEYVHPTPGENGPGAQRVVQGARGEFYYTPDHYRSFIAINRDR